MSASWRLLALPPLPTEALRAGFAPGDDMELIELPSRDRAGLLAAIANADLLLGDWSGQLGLDAETLAAAPHLAFIQQPSAGTDRIDTAAAAERGIPVSNVGEANAVAVAEWCLAAILALTRQLTQAERGLRAGEWPQTTLPIRELRGARVGILGLGGIGRRVADMCAGLGCEVAYWSRSIKGVPYARLEAAALMAASDVVVCLLPGGDETRHLVSADLLAALPEGALFVSAGRGSVVDEAALTAALRSGRLGGAALDVYETEPLPADSPLRDLPNVLLSPHNAGASREAQLAIVAAARANLQRAVAGEPVAFVVNGVDPVVRRR